MSFRPERGKYYRMPVFFGPLPGPRQWPDGLEVDFEKTPKRRIIGLRYRSSREAIDAVLPEGFSVWGEPIVTVEVTYLTELDWLAGRGYNMCDVKVPATFQSKDGPVNATFLFVRWEDLADPILSGREELGHNKLYCEIPPIASVGGNHSVMMSWKNYPFLRVEVEELEEAQAPAGNPANRGLLSYKYMPKTGSWGEADVAYATLTPPAWNGKVTRFWKGAGRVWWDRPAWRDLPTLYTIVNGFAAWPVEEMLGGYMLDMEGGASGSETHRID